MSTYGAGHPLTGKYGFYWWLINISYCGIAFGLGSIGLVGLVVPLVILWVLAHKWNNKVNTTTMIS